MSYNYPPHSKFSNKAICDLVHTHGPVKKAMVLSQTLSAKRGHWLDLIDAVIALSLAECLNNVGFWHVAAVMWIKNGNLKNPKWLKWGGGGYKGDRITNYSIKPKP